MPELQKEVSVRFTARSDDAALLEFLQKMQGAQVQLDAAGEKARGAGQKAGEGAKGFSQLKDAVMDLGQKLLALVALEKLGEWLKRGAEDAANEERALRQVGEAATRWGLDAQAASEKGEALASSLLRIGVDQGDTLKGFRTFVDTLHDLEQAESAVTLSADLATAKDISYAQAQEVVLGLIKGRKGALRDAQEMGAKGAETEQQALDMLTRAYGGYASRLDDSKLKSQAFKAELDEAAQEIGRGLIPVVSTLIDWWHNLILAFEFAGSAVVLFADHAGRAVKEWFTLLSTMAITGEFWKHPLDSLQKVQNAYVRITRDGIKEFVKDVGGAWDQIAADAEAKWSKPGTGLPKPGKIQAKAEKEDGSVEKALKAEADAAKGLAQSLVELRAAETAEAKAALEIAVGKRAVTDATRAASRALDAQRDAEKKALDIESAFAVRQAQAEGQSAQAVEKIHEAFRAKDLALEKKYQGEKVKLTQAWARAVGAIDDAVAAAEKKDADNRFAAAQKAADAYVAMEAAMANRSRKVLQKMNADELRSRLDTLRKARDAARESGLDTLEIDRQIASEEILLQKKVAQAKVETAMTAVQQVAGIASTLFGKNKSVAVAAAIVDTIAASVKAFNEGGGWPYGLIPMAITLATGYARVQEIRQQEPEGGEPGKGKGFDDPRYDAMAEAGGERWARDMVYRYSVGAQRGWARMLGGEAVTGGTYAPTYSNTTHGPTVTVQQSLLSRQMARLAYRDIERQLIPARVANRRGRLGGNVRYGGRVR